MIENPEIAIGYSLTYKDFVAGHKLAARQSIALLAFHIFARYLAGTFAMLLILISLVNILSGHASTVTPLLPMIFLVCLIPTIIWISWRIGFNNLKGSSKVDPQMRFQADETTFAREIHDTGELTWKWSATHSVAENKKVVVISVRRGCFIVLPRRALTDNQIARLKELLSNNRGS